MTDTATTQAEGPRFNPFGEHTIKAMYDLYVADATAQSSIWHTGYPMLDAAIPTIDQGIIVLGGEENGGKTNYGVNICRGVLRYTPQSCVLILALDDSRDVIIRDLVAQTGELSVTDVKLPGRLERDDVRIQQRKNAYTQLMRETSGRLGIVDPAVVQGLNDIHMIVQYITGVRQQIGPGVPLWVCIDAFDNIAGPGSSENEQQKYICQQLEKCFITNDCIIFVTKHLIKGTGRSANMDSLSGPRSLKYAAKLGLIAYNDVRANGQAAEIYYNRTDRDPEEKAPIFEVSIKKNKFGNVGGLLCYWQVPEKYLSIECDPDNLSDLRNRIYEQMGAARRRDRRD